MYVCVGHVWCELRSAGGVQWEILMLRGCASRYAALTLHATELVIAAPRGWDPRIS